MNGQQVREALHAGRRVYGTLISAPSTKWPGVITGLPLDFVFIDTEHIALDRERVAWMCQAYAGVGLAPIVRVPEPNPFLATMALDGGAAGVIFPYVEEPEQVRDLVGAVKYRPLKGARLADLLERGKGPSDECVGYLRRRNAGNVAIINIESVPAIEALPELVRVDGVDGVLVGPHDLSVNLGRPEQYDHPDFEEAIRTILKIARDAGIGAGVHFFWQDLKQEVRWMEEGMNLIVHSTDLRAAALNLETEIGRLREEMGDAAPDRLGGDAVV